MPVIRAPLEAVISAAVISIILLGCAAPAASSDPGGLATPQPSFDVTSPPASASTDPAQPPAAWLAVDGGDPVVGRLGTYSWNDGGSDSPWLPGAPIRAATGETLRVTVDGGTGSMIDWSAVLAPASSPGGADAILVGRGPAALDVVAPEPGAWTLAVTITYDQGSATYFWALDIS